MVREKGKIVVDAEPLNDVTEQVGGGAEPFSSTILRGSEAFTVLEAVKEGLTDAVGAMGTRAVAAAVQMNAATQIAADALQDRFQGGKIG